MGLKKIVLITTGQPSTNPRIVKEADALQSAGFDVTLLYCHFINWATEADKNLLKTKAWKYQITGGSPFQNRGIYTFTRLRFKLARLLNQYFGNRMLVAERAQARAYDELLKAAKKMKADWYIGHNLGALSVAVKAANFNGGKAGFDFEDYHRGESSEATNEEINRIIYLENKYVPQLDYSSAASPLIAEKIVEHFPLQKDNIITLLNCFPLSQQPPLREKAADDHSLQLFWFSQTIGLNRGLEILLEALAEMNDPDIHLTLAGNCNEEFRKYIETHDISLKQRICLAGIIAPEDLPNFASKFDIGLALELFVPENRNICLTNKIFTYLLAGNAMLLSSSAMQNKFNNQFKVGLSFPINQSEILIEKLKRYKNPNFLHQQRTHNYELGRTILNWEIESEKLLKLIKA